MTSQILVVRALDIGENVSTLSLSDESTLKIPKGTSLQCVAEGSTVNRSVAISRVLSSIRSHEPLVLSTDNINKFDTWFPVPGFVTLVTSSPPKSVNQDPIPKKKGPVNMAKKKSPPVKAEICPSKVTPKGSQQKQFSMDEIFARIASLDERSYAAEQYAVSTQRSLTDEIRKNEHLMGLVNKLSDRVAVLETTVIDQESEIACLKELDSAKRLELEDIQHMLPDDRIRISALEKSFAQVNELVKEERTSDVNLSRMEVSPDDLSFTLPVKEESSSVLIDNAMSDLIRMNYAKQVLYGFTQSFTLNEETTQRLRAAGFILDEEGALKPVVF
jgi:hypothetical protein